MQLAEEAWPDLREYFEAGSLALIPLGSTEQHGPHLPCGTDYLIADAFAREAAERTGHFCTPPIPIGVSAHHRQFSGTMWVDPDAFRSYVTALTRNLTSHGIDRVIYVNAHGGNVTALREVGRQLREEGEVYAIEWMWNDSIPDLVEELFSVPGPHGGPKETSLIQYLHPTLVHEDRFEDARDGGLVEWRDEEQRVHGARTYYDTIDNTANGVLGDQTDASAEKGRQCFEAASDHLVALCEWLEVQDPSDLMPKPHV